MIARRDLDKARAALGLVGGRQVSSPDYWRQVLGLTNSKFEGLLRDLNVPMRPTARRLPKGAVGKLRRYAKVRGKPIAPAEPVEPRPPEEQKLPFEWRTVGTHPVARLLSGEEIARIHWLLVEDFAADADPIDPPGVLSASLLESAAFRPSTAHGRTSKYPTAEMAGAALLHSVVHNHPFFNGNKRTGLVSLLVTLDQSGLTLTCDETELFKFVLRVAQHRVAPKGKLLPDREVLWMAEWITSNSRVVDKGLRPLQWRQLRRILIDFGCKIAPAPSVGNRLNISRAVRERARFGRTRTRILRTQVRYADPGRDASRSTIAKLRQDLHLDDDYGIDSRDFYGGAEARAEDFIIRYRKTLTRLAKL